jgi:nicotinamidase/pyrazinamidase
VTQSKESDRALILIDMVVDRVSKDGARAIPGAHELVRFVQGELRYFRERGRPVIFVCTVGADGVMPTILQELTPRTGERVLAKRAFSAFFETGLDEVLPRQSVRRLTLTGVETNTSILMTAADAWARGYHVVVPEPCVCARDVEDHRFALRQIREVWPSQGPPPPGQRPAEPMEPTSPGTRAPEPTSRP